MSLADTPTLSSHSLPPLAALNVNGNHSVSLSLLPLNDGWILFNIYTLFMWYTMYNNHVICVHILIISTFEWSISINNFVYML